MKKDEIIQKILDNVNNVECFIVRTYGVSHGVGYDLNVRVTYKSEKELIVEAHALSKSWACLGHLRPHNPVYKYTGSNDIYKEQVMNYWDSGKGFKEYLARLLKTELLDLLNNLK